MRSSSPSFVAVLIGVMVSVAVLAPTAADAKSLVAWSYRGILTERSMYFDVTPPAPNLILGTLLRLELNTTAPPATGVTAYMQASVRDPNQNQLTNLNHHFGTIDSAVSLVCPGAFDVAASTSNYTVIVTGTIGSAFFVRVNFVTGDIAIDGTPTPTLVSDNLLFKLYFFELTPALVPEKEDEGNSFQIEVVSSTYDLAYLYITAAVADHQCVTGEMIHTASNHSARLTFSQNATFTLSRGSVPYITPARWYVAVMGRNVTSDAIKDITIKVKTGFSYSYSYAICMTLLLPAAIAFVIIVATHVPGGAGSCRAFALSVPGRWIKLSKGTKDEVETARARTEEEFVDPALPGSAAAMSEADREFFLDNPAQGTREACSCDCFRRFLKFALVGKTQRGYSFSWHTLILACGFGVAVYQVVFLQWRTQQLTGNRDTCAYNERCYHPHPDWDLPWNNIISNFPYMILGVSFVIHTALFQWQRPSADFSLFYAMGWGLVTEGCFSLFYHVCPTVPIFQFDTAFMFVIAMLSLLAVYQSGEGDFIPQAKDVPYENDFFKVAHFLLFAIIPLWIFNYLGALFDTDEIYGSGNYVAFWVCVCTWEFLLFAYVGYRFVDPRSRMNGKQHGMFDCCCKYDEANPHACHSLWARYAGFFFYALGGLGYIGWSIAIAYTREQKVAGMFLIKTLLAAFVGLARVARLNRLFGCGKNPCSKPPRCDRFVGMSFIIIAFVGLMLTALTFFVASSTDKNYDAWVSRTFNRDCYDVSLYFDVHDLWHIIGAFGLFLNFCLLLYVNPPPNRPVVARNPKLEANIRERQERVWCCVKFTAPLPNRQREQKEKQAFIDNWQLSDSATPAATTTAASGGGGVAVSAESPLPATSAGAGVEMPAVSGVATPRGVTIHLTPGIIAPHNRIPAAGMNGDHKS